MSEPLTASAPRLRRLLTWDEALLLWVSRLHMPRLTRLMLGLTRSGQVWGRTAIPVGGHIPGKLGRGTLFCTGDGDAQGRRQR